MCVLHHTADPVPSQDASLQMNYHIGHLSGLLCILKLKTLLLKNFAFHASVYCMPPCFYIGISTPHLPLDGLICKLWINLYYGEVRQDQILSTIVKEREK